jgi:hypothetical protein
MDAVSVCAMAWLLGQGPRGLGSVLQAATSESKDEMVVQIDLYSGRPNPRWSLDEAQSAELIRRLDAMPEVDKGEPAQGLGYRGVIVTMQDGASGRPVTIIVSAGIVLERFYNGTERRRRDLGRSLESWIINTGRSHLDPTIYKHIKQQLGP